ncbi:MAG: UDP-N-acetylglucosamine 1-carboxyvinyltransferase [Chloroflexi bacterium]|nr:UDP-N-acetylglucosamine 1-carboxyvinyltransferase [Chloroflexota bacterium]
MEKFLIEGGYPLEGTVYPSANKNAALPILAASLLTDQRVIIRNVPHIRDVSTMLEILVDLGVEIEHLGKHDLALRAKTIRKTAPDRRLCEQIRASMLVAGPLLARCGRVEMPPPGGCVIGRRRIDTHLLAMEALGANIEVDTDYQMRANGFQGKEVFLDEASVTATENALMVAAVAEGRTVIFNAASEPHVQDLARFLVKMGAQIAGIGSNTLTIDGVRTLQGAEHTIVPDHIEVGSFMGLAAVTNSKFRIANVVHDDLRMTCLVMDRLGVKTETVGNDLIVSRKEPMAITPDIGMAVPKIDDGPWPAFPADLMSIALVVATQAAGTTLFFEKMFESRMFFIDKLVDMGAQIILCDPHRAVVVGPSRLRGSILESPDIRAGMALLIAALGAKGQSIIGNIGQIDRGYERVEERLRDLGAHIERITVKDRP